MLNRIAMMVLICLLAIGIFNTDILTGQDKNAISMAAEEQRIKLVVEKARLKVDDAIAFQKYIKTLANKRDFSGLKAICDSKMPDCESAAYEYVCAQNPEGAIAFCRQFPIHSSTWLTGFLSLADFPKEAIIGYLKEIALNPNPHARYACYKLCTRKLWVDFADCAENDLGSNEYAGVPNVPEEASLGSVAKAYLQAIGRIPPSPPPTNWLRVMPRTKKEREQSIEQKKGSG